MLKVCPNTHTHTHNPSAKTCFWFQLLKAISTKFLAAHYAEGLETSLVTHDREYELYKISSESHQRNNYSKQ